MADGYRNEDGSINAQAFIAALDKSRQEHALVVAQRPDAPSLADTITKLSGALYTWAHLHRERACLLADIEPQETNQWRPLANSVADADHGLTAELVETYCTDKRPQSLQWLDTNPTRNPTSWALQFLRRCFHTAVDHIGAIGLLLEHEAPIRSPITLSRTALEAGATACFMADTTVDSHERLRRFLNPQFAELREQYNENRADDARTAELEAEMTELAAFAELAGFTVKRTRSSDWGPWAILGAGRNRADSTQLIVDKVLPDGLGSSMWRSMSAIAHSREALTLIPDEYMVPHEVAEWQRVEVIAWHTIPSLVVVRELCVRLDAFVGWDFAEWTDVVDLVINQWSIAAGLHDETIRENLGLERHNP